MAVPSSRRWWPGSLSGRHALWLASLVVLVMIAWFCRIGILRSIGGFLVREDAPAHGDAMYVLGGAALERSIAAERFFREGWASHIVFTGANTPDALGVFGIKGTEAAMGQRVSLLAGVPVEHTELLEVGTSTWEEAQAVRDHALAHQYDTVLVVTTEFHTRRVGNVFREAIEPSGITVLVRAAPSVRYNPARWWEKEDGLLMVNNEYVKLVYYLWKY